MLKSTYTPSAALAQPLPAGWTEHKAPTGHLYYYNASTQESTYTFPGAAPAFSVQPPAPAPLNLADPNVANAWMARHRAPAFRQQDHGPASRGRGGLQNQRGRPQPNDRPISRYPIPGHEPWFLVFTKYGRRFAFDAAKNESFWRIPEKLKDGILELDQQRIREKAGLEQAGPNSTTEKPASDQPAEQEEEQTYDSSEYEEVEVTDDEAEGTDDADEGANGDADGARSAKRQRTEQEEAEVGPVEFDEADIAYQLQAMGDEYGLEQGEYDDGNMDDWPEGVEGLTLSDEDASALFRDLLNDFRINPYSSWDKLIEEGKIIEDSRYTVLGTMKARREVWEAWSREKIQALKEARAKQEKTDPRIPYLAFLQEKATPKLYWPEFKRKYRKEDVMRDSKMADKDREKLYRDHINRLKLPQATLKADILALLRSLPLSKLNNTTMGSHLPSAILADLRYISLQPSTRDPLIEAYIQTLGPPPDEDEAKADEENEAAAQAKEARRKREAALAERERAVAEEKARTERRLRAGRAMLRDEERVLEQAMHVGKSGLQSQLAADQGSRA